MQIQNNYNPGQKAATVTASPNLQTEVARNNPNDSASRLVQSLGADSTKRALTKYQQVTEQRKLQQQEMKVDGYPSGDLGRCAGALGFVGIERFGTKEPPPTNLNHVRPLVASGLAVVPKNLPAPAHHETNTHV